MNRNPVLYFSFLFAFLLFACNRNRIILHPEFESKNTIHGIEKIELCDSAAIFDMAYYNLPDYWVKSSSSLKLRGTTTNREYALKWIEGLGPDIMVHVDSTGFLNARLFFEPIDPSDSSVDMIEGGEFIYNGIKLKETERGKIKTTLSGTLKAMGASWLIVKVNDPYFPSKRYTVPVRNGVFHYDIYTDEPLVCEVFIGKEYLEGFIEDFPEFWSEGGEVILNFNNGNSKGFTLQGGPLTESLSEYSKRRKSYDKNVSAKIPEIRLCDSLRDNRLFYVPEYYSLIDQIKNVKVGWQRLRLRKRLRELMSNDSVLTKEGKAAEEALNQYDDSIWTELDNQYKLFYEKEFTDASMIGLYGIYKHIKYNKDLDEYLGWFNTFYSDTLTSSAYHRFLRELSDLGNPVVGNHFVNITLKDKEGKYRSLSDLIKGKRALLIFESEEMKPENLKSLLRLYDNLKSDSFEIVNIAIEPDSLEYTGNSTKHDYPWPLLFDNKDKTGAWRKYRLGNIARRSFLVDENGIIIAIDLPPSEIASFINQYSD